MYINQEEQSIVCKICFYGPPAVGKGEALEALYSHFASSDGEHSEFERRQFAPADEVEASLGEAAASQFVSAASEAMGVPYPELVEGGELVWLRTRLSAADDQSYAVYADSYSVSGEAETDALRDFTLRGADALVFVADGLDPDGSAEAWEALQSSDWNGETVLLVMGTTFTEEVEEALGFEGRSFASGHGFEETLEAFFAACEAALERARGMN